LSNHPAAMRSAQQERYAQAEQSRQVAYDQELAAHEASLQEAIRASQDARADGHWLTWLRRRWTVRTLQRRKPHAPPPPSWDSDEEAILAAGIQGERTVLEQLGRVFDDAWVDLCGYKNRCGEIDQLLLGPTGLFGIEIKHRNGVVYCDGDDWWLEKYDRYGNRVEQGPITDRRGRSPSVQLTEPAHELEAFLARRDQPVRITPIVVLTHPRSQLGSADNLTVHVTADPGYLTALVRQAPHQFDAARCAQIERLIRKDHAFHDRGRRRR